MIYVDSHVHIHEGVDLGRLFACATRNFELAERAYGDLGEESRQRVLCLTETQSANKFHELASWATQGKNEIPDWQTSATSEDESLLVAHPNCGELIVIAGRQIVTAERLEVLAIGTKKVIPDGEPIVDVIQRVQANQALAVIPWGFGKWLGSRGAVLERVLGGPFRQPLFLGDNSGRPKYWRQPRQFADARNGGMLILPGSDPLPFRSEYKRIGSFGLVVEGVVCNKNPTADLKRLLLAEKPAVHPYGQLENPLRFLRNQIAMQYRNRIGLR